MSKNIHAEDPCKGIQANECGYDNYPEKNGVVCQRPTKVTRSFLKGRMFAEKLHYEYYWVNLMHLYPENLLQGRTLIVHFQKPSNWRMRVGWRILRSALASIWRTRSRVTLNTLPTSSRVRGSRRRGRSAVREHLFFALGEGAEYFVRGVPGRSVKAVVSPDFGALYPR
jgi:hypothetical protein